MDAISFEMPINNLEASNAVNNFHLVIYCFHPRFCSLDNQRVRTRVAALFSTRYFLTSLRSTDALGNRIFVRAVTLYSNPNSPTICWTSNSRLPRGGAFSAAFEGREEGRDRFEDGELPVSVLLSSAKISKTQPLPPEGPAMGSPCTDR